MDIFSLVARLTLDSSQYDDGIDAAKGRASGFAKAAKVGAAALAATTTAIGAFTSASVNAGKEFDASMSKVAAISGATGADFDALREKAQDMGASTKFSASEAADAMSYMAMAGWKTDQMLGGISGVMNLAAASGEDLATTSDIVTDALTAFGLTAEDSGHFADVLAAASSNANTNVSMMGETFKYAAPVAGALGFSAEDTAEAIGLMANSGIKASQAGTSLRMIMNKMTGPIDIAGDKLGELTIETQNADGTMRDMSDILDDLRGAYGQLTDAEKAQAAVNIAGKNAMSGFLALMNTSEDDLNKLRTAINECDGAAEEMANTMQDNLAGDITIFKSALEGAQIAISDGLTPTLRTFVQFGTKSISTLTTAFREDGLAGAMNALGGIIDQGLAMLIETLPQVIDSGARLLMALLEGLPALADAALQIILSLAQHIADSLPELVPTIVDVVLQIVDTLTDPSTLSALIDASIAIIVALANGLIDAMPRLIEKVPEIIVNLVTAIIQNAPKLMEAAAQLMLAMARGVVQNISAVLSAIGQLGTGIWNAVSNIVSGAWDWGKDLIENFVDGIKAFIHKPIEAISGLASRIKSFLGFSEPEEGPLSNFHTYAPDMMELFAKGITDNRDLITDAIGSAFNVQGQIAGNTGGQTFTTPMAGGAPRNIVVKLMLDGKEFAQTAFPYMSAEEQRVGLSLVTR